MTIKLEFISVIVPISKIEAIMGKGSFRKHFDVDLPDLHHDADLLRQGCMNKSDLGGLLDDWEAEGFQLTETRNGEKCWKDVCVCYSNHGPSYPCDWLKYDSKENSVTYCASQK